MRLLGWRKWVNDWPRIYDRRRQARVSRESECVCERGGGTAVLLLAFDGVVRVWMCVYTLSL